MGNWCLLTSLNCFAKAILDFAAVDFSSRKQELRAMMEEKFSWDANVERLVEIYEELI